MKFTVLGDPASKGSRIAGRRKNGSIYTRPASKKEAPWIEAVAYSARFYAKGVTLMPPYRVDLEFLFPRPAKPSHAHPSRIDIDKAARAVLDGLVRGGVISDDRHVTELVARKVWAEWPEAAGCRVEVTTTHPAPCEKDQGDRRESS